MELSDEGSDATLGGLHHWFCKSFSKLGWMLLAKQHGKQYKVDAYLHSLQDLASALSAKEQTVENEDHRTDLRIMLQHLQILIRNAQQLLTVPSATRFLQTAAAAQPLLTRSSFVQHPSLQQQQEEQQEEQQGEEEEEEESENPRVMSLSSRPSLQDVMSATPRRPGSLIIL